MRHFDELQTPPMDEVMRVSQQWDALKAQRPDAVNTTVGVMYDPVTSRIWRPDVMRLAAHRSIDDTYDKGDFGYQTQVGHLPYLRGMARLVFGEDFVMPDDAVMIQTDGGTGGLALASYLLAPADRRIRSDYEPVILHLDDGWPNYHSPVTFGSSFDIKPFARTTDRAQNHQASMQALEGASRNDAVLSQPRGYNDDGIDASKAEVDERLDIIEAKDVIHIIDGPYIGLAEGWSDDRYMVLESIRRGITTIVTTSASKTMGQYNGRVGAMYVFNEDPAKVGANLKGNVRGLLSNAALDNAKTSAYVLDHAELRKQYLAELEQMRLGLVQTRRDFAEVLGSDFDFVRDGHGLFAKLSATAFTDAQFEYLKNRHGVLALPKTRVNLGGIPAGQAERVAHAFLDTMQRRKSL